MDLTFVTWKWKSPFQDGREFPASAVNVLRASVAKHYRRPHRFVCVTDDTTGLDRRVEVFPIPETGLEAVSTPVPPLVRGGKTIHYASCFRRLWMFSREAMQLGEWVFVLDLDCLVIDRVEPLIDRFPADFVGWLREADGRWRKRPTLAGAIYKLRTGSHVEVWEDFEPATSPQEAVAAGYNGSDQAWMSYKLLPTRDRMWTEADGVAKLNIAGPRKGRDRILFTVGSEPPWNANRNWVAYHWWRMLHEARCGVPHA